MNGYQALTDKEKETLRLLVNGYDAKSMARHLGLSVHTINERLRDARRKMATSSSREAARLVRAEEYRTPPKLLGDERLGEAAAVAAVAELAPTDEVPGRRLRRFGWIAGGIAMSFTLALLALSALSGTAQAPSATLPPVAMSETMAGDAAQVWLELGDAGRWDEAYAGTSASFQHLNTGARWSEVSQRVRAPLGALVSRVLIGEDDVPTPPRGARIVKFRTSFANKPAAIETLALVREGGSWKVTGIYLD